MALRRASLCGRLGIGNDPHPGEFLPPGQPGPLQRQTCQSRRPDPRRLAGRGPRRCFLSRTRGWFSSPEAACGDLGRRWKIGAGWNGSRDRRIRSRPDTHVGRGGKAGALRRSAMPPSRLSAWNPCEGTARQAAKESGYASAASQSPTGSSSDIKRVWRATRCSGAQSS